MITRDSFAPRSSEALGLGRSRFLPGAVGHAVDLEEDVMTERGAFSLRFLPARRHPCPLRRTKEDRATAAIDHAGGREGEGEENQETDQQRGGHAVGGADSAPACLADLVVEGRLCLVAALRILSNLHERAVGICR